MASFTEEVQTRSVQERSVAATGNEISCYLVMGDPEEALWEDSHSEQQSADPSSDWTNPGQD